MIGIPDVMGYEVAASVIGKGPKDIIAKLNNTTKEQIATAAKETMAKYSPTKNSKVVGNTAKMLNQLKINITSLKNQIRQAKVKIDQPPSSPPQPQVNEENANPRRAQL